MKKTLLLVGFFSLFLAGCGSQPVQEAPTISPALAKECEETAKEQMQLNKEYSPNGSSAAEDDSKAYKSAYNNCLMVNSMKASLPNAGNNQNQALEDQL